MGSTLIEYTVVYQEVRRDDALCHVHATGCADLTRSPDNRRGQQVQEKLDLDHLPDHMIQLDPDELGYEAHDVRVHHCAQRVHLAAKDENPEPRDMKNVKLKRGTRVHAPALNGRPACRPTGDAERFEATSKPVSCASCLEIVGGEAPAEEPKPTRTRRAAQPVTVKQVEPAEITATMRKALDTAQKSKVPSHLGTAEGYAVTTTGYTRRKLEAAGLLDEKSHFLTEKGLLAAGIAPVETPEQPAKPRRASRRATTPDPAPQPASAEHSPRRGPTRVRVSKNRTVGTGATPSPTPDLDESSVIKDGARTASPRKRRNGKAQETAAAQAEVITNAAIKGIEAKRESATEEAGLSVYPGVNPKCTPEQAALAVRVRELREQGMAWWKIGHELSLPGGGPTVKQGKGGAAQARRAWERAWGKTYGDTNTPRETKAVKKERTVTHDARPFFSEDIPDKEILDIVEGQAITWFTRVGTNGGAVVSEQVAEVHPGSGKIVEGPKGRVLEFDERIYETTTGGHGVKTPMVGPRRSVYVDRIEKVGV